MSKEQKPLKSCHILDRLREWFELYGNQNHQRAEEELHLAIDELYDYQQKDQKISDLEAKLAEKEAELVGRKKLCDLRYEQLKKQHQDKIEFAVEQLEQLKHDIWTDQQDDGWLDEQVDIYFLTETIDNQIKRLTHQHEDKGE